MSEFAGRLNLLFAAFLQPASEHSRRREEWSDSEVARLAGTYAGEGEKSPVSRQYIGMLRGGKRQPSLRAANVIALVFAELSRRDETPVEVGAILNYLAGDHPAAIVEDLEPRDLVALLASSEPRLDQEIRLLAREGGDLGTPGALDAVASLLDQLARQDAAPMRRRLARLLGVRSTDIDS